MNKKRVFLANPPGPIYIRDGRCQSRVGDFAVSVDRPPQEILTIATKLNQKGHQVLLRDYPAESRNDFVADVIDFAPDILIINSTLPSLDDDISYFKVIKDKCPEVQTVLRCGQIESCAEEIMQDHPSIDVILYGECELEFSDLVSGKSISETKGLFFRDGNSVKRTDVPSVPEDLDQICRVDRSLINNSLYLRPDTGRALALIETARGCPCECIFCLTPSVYGRRVRRRSVDSVIGEIRECVDVFKINDFHFKSDLFTADRKWVIDLCERIKAELPEIRWFANSRVNTVDAELLSLMRSSGCFAISFGVESGSDMILKKIQKGISREDAEKAFALCRDAGIESYAYFLIGFPWDTEETIEETRKFMLRLDPDFCDCFLPSVFPGTKLFRIAEEKGLLETGLSRNSYSGAQMRTETLSCAALEKARTRIMRSFYFRPAYVMRIFRRIRSFKEFNLILKSGFLTLIKLVIQ